MGRQPAVSINLCCYNSQRFLEETLQSIFAQTFSDWELVVVNDGSTDQTEDIIRSHLEAWPIVYASQPNRGLAASRNKAIELSRGELIAFIDHDDVWLPEKLAEQVALYRACPDLGLIYADCYLIDSSGNLTGLGSAIDRPQRGRVFEHLLRANFISLSCAVVPRTVIAEIGTFAPLQIFEDYELWLRIAHQYAIDYVSRPLAKYRRHAAQASRDSTLALQEWLRVCDYWQERLEENAKPLLEQTRSRAYQNAAVAALIADGDGEHARYLLRRSWAHRASGSLLALYALSFLRRAAAARAAALMQRLRGLLLAPARRG